MEYSTINELKKNIKIEGMKNTKEEFKVFKINNEDTKYLVSNYGKIINSKTGKEIKLHEQNYGFYGFTVSHNGKSYSFKIARVVAEYFIPNDDPIKTHVAHRSGDKSDNGVWNLEWVTPSENQQHAIAMGLSPNIITYFTDETIRTVCKMLEDGVSCKQISVSTGVSQKTVSDILNKKSHVLTSSQYDFSKRGETKSGKKASMSDETIHTICKMWLKGELAKTISDELGIPENTVYGVVYKNYKQYLPIVNQYDFSARKKNSKSSTKGDENNS